MGNKRRVYDDTYGFIFNLVKLIIVAIILIVLLFYVIKSLIGKVPAYVGSVFVFLFGIYLYATKKSISNYMNDWLRGKR